jgi:hypothetical protein
MILNFKKFDVEFNVDEENYLMIGENILFESEFMTQVELEEWALNNDFDYDSLDEVIKVKNDYDLENGNELSSPHSRAFDFFSELDFEVSENLGVELIDGPQPGSDLRGVKLLNKELLPLIQNLLLENQIKANFIMNSKF